MQPPSLTAWRTAKELPAEARAVLRDLAAGLAVDPADVPMALVTRQLATVDLLSAWPTDLGWDVARILGPRRTKAGAGFPGRPPSSIGAA